MADEYGSIVINADLNPQSFEQGSKGMQKAIQSLHTQTEKLGTTFRKAMSGNMSAMKEFDAKSAGIAQTISEVERQLDRLGHKTVETDQYKSLVAELDKVNAKASALEKKLANASGSRRKSELTGQLEEARNRSDELLQKIIELEDSGAHLQLAGDTEQFAGYREAIEQIRQQLGDMQVSARQAKVAMSGLSKAKIVFAGLGKAIQNGVRHLMSMKKQSGGLSQQIGKLSRGLTSFVGRLKSRVLRQIITGIFNGVKEGINNLAQVVPSLNDSLSTIKSSLTTLKNGFAAAVAPIINAVVPALATLINYCVMAVTWIGKLIAALSGASTFTKATAVQEDYANSLGASAGAAKELKRQLAGFDHLNILNDNESGGGGGGSSLTPQDMFEEVPIESSIKDWANRLKEALRNQNYFEFGEIIGEGITNAFQYAFDFLSNINFSNYGKIVAETINGIFSGLDLSVVMLTIVTLVNGIFDFFGSMFSTLDWAGIASNIANAISTAFREFDWAGNAATISLFLVGLLTALATLVKETDWESLGRGIADAILNIDWKSLLQGLGDILWGVLTGIFAVIRGLISEFIFGFDEDIAVFREKTKEMADALQNFQNDLLEKKDGFEAQKKYAGELVDQLDVLKGKYGDAYTKTDEYRSIVSELCKIYPELNGYINSETGELELSNDQLRDKIDLLTNQYILEALGEEYKELAKLQRQQKKVTDGAKDYKDELDELVSAMADGNKISDLTTEQYERIDELTGHLLSKTKNWAEAESILKIKQADANKAYAEAQALLDDYGNEMSSLEEEMRSYQKTTDETGEKVSGFAGTVNNASTQIQSHIQNKLAPALKADLPLAVKEGMDEAVNNVDTGTEAMKASFDSVSQKLDKPLGRVKFDIDNTYETVKESWEAIKSTEITKKIGGNVLQSFKDAASEFKSIESGSATKTIKAERGAGFKDIVKEYNDLKDKTVNVKLVGNSNSGISYTYGLASGGIVSNSGRVSWFDSVRKYASGTMRARGSLFVAGEAGPEVVGHVNGRTEVLNKSQIASAIYEAVVSAMGAAFSQPIPIQLSTIGGNAEALSGLYGYQAPVAGSILPYEIERQIDAINALSDQVEESADEVARRVVDAIMTQTAAIVTAIRSQGRGGNADIDYIDAINRQTRMYGSPQILGG